MTTKRNIRKLNALLLALLALMTLGLVGTTYAFYTSSAGVENMLITKGSEVFLQEYFSPDDLWVAGETKTKEVWFGNQSELDQVIRFKVKEEWFDNNGTPGDLTDDTPWTWSGTYSPSPAVLNWTSEITGGTPTWTKIGDYYYYNKVLEKQSGSSPTETLPVLSSVTFSSALANNPSFGDDFSDKACRITIEMEALDVNTAFTQDAWKTTFSQSGTTLTWTATP